MDKHKIFNELTQCLLYYKRFEKANSGIIAKINYQDNSDLKSYLHYYVDNKEIKSINPGIMYLSQKQNYFQNSREMVVFFIETAFNKKINLQTYKKFSTYEISFDELKKVNTLLLSEKLEGSLEVKTISSKMKI